MAAVIAVQCPACSVDGPHNVLSAPPEDAPEVGYLAECAACFAEFDVPTALCLQEQTVLAAAPETSPGSGTVDPSPHGLQTPEALSNSGGRADLAVLPSPSTQAN